MDYTQRITRDLKVCGGEPVIAGTRVTVRAILASLAEGARIEKVLADFPTLTEEDVRAVIAFAAVSAEEDLPADIPEAPPKSDRAQEFTTRACPNPQCSLVLRVPKKGRLRVTCPQCRTVFMYDSSLDAIWNVHASESACPSSSTESSERKDLLSRYWNDPYRVGRSLGRFCRKSPGMIWVGLIVTLFIGFVVWGVQQPLAPSLPSSTSARTGSFSAKDRNPLQNALESSNRPSAQQVSTPVSLPNGTEIVPPRGYQGRGELKVMNGTSFDATLKLVKEEDPKRLLRFVYVRLGQEVTVKGIGDGTYLLVFALGTNWDSPHKKFSQMSAFHKFDEPLAFKTKKIVRDVGNQLETQGWRVTLNPVPDGKARTSSISQEAFDELQ